MDSEEVENLNFNIVSIGREEMNLAVCAQCFIADELQMLHGQCFIGAALLRHIVHALNRAIPHDILNVDIVSNQDVAVIIDIDNAYQSVALQTEIIEERRILTERVVTVIGKINWRLIVAKKNDDTFVNELLEFIAPPYVSSCIKHFCFH